MSFATDIDGLIHTPLEEHVDTRGSFAEIMRATTYPAEFVQSNHSRSRKGVLRGLHYHLRQSDLWYVVRGEMEVGLVDLRHREDPPRAMTVRLSSEEPATLFIPHGIAHGFLALSDVDLIYWVSNYYDASDEFGIAWDDPQLGLGWSETQPIVSDRDAGNPPLKWNQIPAFS